MRAVWTIISLNAAVFGAWQYAKAKNDRALDRQLYENATLMEANLQAGRNHTLITSAFSHREPGHFLFNMVSFHAFGTVLATVSGVRAAHVIALAVGSAAAGSVAWLYHLRTSKRPQSTIQKSKGVFSSFGGGQIARHIYVGLGASGMVMGLGAAATCLRPSAPMNLMFIPISIPLWAITALYFGVDAYYLNSDSKVGHSAHLGGAVFGATFYLLALRNRGGIWTMLRRGLRR
ncbi:hypothetical protein M409DRAFT_66698 [Zasmidium cellare ATCC 36951]|uniref:Peptidase S54 rhomboid domain-containing protein n=1 Tax=Zasmidium cellare ATCC 36951 TaxID=1080233 RepID=A0A6A6CG26_ZASCE|nr:uncharacterized protein M409DRAFT_66698 [Zasmidium cellare ATCC 36951]KAF2166207.1 hypothetical protein M409DRAFT_66698 [Zasmidium cellare ATCC 36951]